MQARRTALGAWFLVALFVLQTTCSVIDFGQPVTDETLQNSDGVEWVQFDLVDGVYADAVGVSNQESTEESRSLTANSRIGIFDADGLHLDRPLSSVWLQGRADLRLVLIDTTLEMQHVRKGLDDVAGVTVREFISPSGLMLQGTPAGLNEAVAHEGVMVQHAVPLGMLVDDAVLDVLLLEQGIEDLQG